VQTVTFQVVLASDSRTLSSYVMFNYENVSSSFAGYPSAQGYQTADGGIDVYNLPSSMSVSAQNLSNMIGNTGMYL